MKEEKIVENAEKMGELLAEKLNALAQKHSIIGEVRGTGVFWAIELVSNQTTREKLSAEKMNEIKTKLIDKGLLPFLAENRIHVVPPCIVSEAEIEQAINILDAVFESI